jgi:hypothetical protein
MSFTAVIKRVLPFLLTFAVGLFIASFFVDLVPRPQTYRGHRRGRCREVQELRMQYLQERERSEQLQQQLEQVRQNPIDLKHVENWNAPGPDMPPPPPPVKAPRAVR